MEDGGGGRDLPRRIKGLWFLACPRAGRGPAVLGQNGSPGHIRWADSHCPAPVTLVWLCPLEAVAGLVGTELPLPPPLWTPGGFFMGLALPLGATPSPSGEAGRGRTALLLGPGRAPEGTQPGGGSPSPKLSTVFSETPSSLLQNLFLLVLSCLLDSSFSALFSPSP